MSARPRQTPEQLAAPIRQRLEAGRHDAELLDGPRFQAGRWDRAERNLDELVEYAELWRESSGGPELAR